MSEFKFACPVCGQHVSAGAADAGKQIECPTCFQKMVVPQPPTSGSNLIRRAASAEPSKRPGTQVVRAGGPSQGQRRAIPWTAICLAGVCAFAGVLAYRFGDRAFHGKPSAEIFTGEEHRNVESSADSPPLVFPWSLELTNATFLEQPAVGRLRGQSFQPNRTVLQGGVLTFRQGKSAPADLVLTVMLHADKGEDLAGRLVQVSAKQSRAPTVLVRWKAGATRLLTERHRSGYALRVLFGQPADGRMPGKIWISLPDIDQSFVSGTFEAEIRAPLPPKKPGAGEALHRLAN